jgi:transposase
MPTLHHAPSRVLGLDVANKTITVFDSLTSKTTTIDNSSAAIAQLLAPLGGTDLCVIEPTGGYEARAIAAMSAAGIACHRADTLKVKAFLRSFGTLGKSDALDARGLARYGMERWAQLALFTPRDQTQQVLTALVARRHDLVTLKVAETNRRAAPGPDLIKASCDALLAVIAAQLTAIEKQIDALIENDVGLRQRIAVTRSLPGVGLRTAVALAALMPELGQLDRRQAASLAGLAPHPRDSGTIRAHRTMRGGRPQVRAVLFMAALAASRANGPLKDVYKRLIAAGKKPIVAIGAIMRKIIVILNARIRDTIQQQS